MDEKQLAEIEQRRRDGYIWGEDVDALCAEVRRLRRELEARKDDAKHEAWERDEAI